MPYPQIDMRRARVFPLSARKNQLTWSGDAASAFASGQDVSEALGDQIRELANRIKRAKESGASVMMTYGAHLVKNFAAPLVRRLLDEGWVTHLATQGAGVIHDFELALQGQTGESVRENAPAGRFGSWDETGRMLSWAVLLGASEGLGLGESVGRMLSERRLLFPDPEILEDAICACPEGDLAPMQCELLRAMRHQSIPVADIELPLTNAEASILAKAYERGVPFTVHPGIGYDIIINHPAYSGASMGRAAETDARVFAKSVDRLDGGVYLSVGSAIMSPQVFEKAFSLSNNVRNEEGRGLIANHTIAVVDLQATGGWDWSQGEPPSDNPAYYLRFCKSFARMGGDLHYLQCDNRVLLHRLLEELHR